MKEPRFNRFCLARFICRLLDRLHFSRLAVLTVKWQDWCVFIKMMSFRNCCSLSRYLTIKSRSSHPRCSIKTGVLRNFAKFKGKHLCQRLFFNKNAGLRPATIIKKRLWHRCFPVNFAKFLRAPFLQNTSGRLLLKI